MGWVMGLEPVIKWPKCIGITTPCKTRVQFRVQIALFYKEIAKVLCSICNIFLS